MRLSEKQRDFTCMMARLIIWAYGRGLELTMGHAWRDTETQRRLVAMKLSKTIKSKHLDRLAVDLNLFIEGRYATNSEDYRVLGEFWESMGGRWGGRFGVDKTDYATKIGWDAGHFEYN
ncbi:MAG: M15 family metallopeptidase [Deltaproteobacteria bacterium]|nr:M15 family metallopeptidase [Deltaproteobacteria bacterium]